MAAKKSTKWIAQAMGKKGQLHEDLKVPLGQKIPRKLLEETAKRSDAVGKRARLALTLAGFHHSKAANAEAVTAAVKRGRRAKKKAKPPGGALA